MKVTYYYASCIMTIIFHAQAMNNDTIQNIRATTNKCSIISGWMFCVAYYSPYFKHKMSYPQKRALLGCCLGSYIVDTSLSIAQYMCHKEKSNE